ncbi:hypothetical protein ON010_g6098 [Phytophthora cinnamomi]|nr:hypothetical protein ON010_g6098 [Phytophthora cinnamomi]
MYADQRLDINEEMLAHVTSQDIYHTVDAFMQQLEHATNKYEILVRWEGLEALEDFWESVVTMFEDVPIKLQDYVDGGNDDGLRQFVLKLKSRQQGGKRGATHAPQPPPRGKHAKRQAAKPKPTTTNRRRRRTTNTLSM